MRIIFEQIDWSLQKQVLPNPLAHYCTHVHRKLDGAQLQVSDGAGQEALFALRQRAEGWQIERAGEIIKVSNLAPISLFCGLPKGDKLDRITRQASELGIREIIILRMARNVVQLDEKRARKRLERLARVAIEAARQSERSDVLVIKGVLDFSEGIEYAQTLSKAFFFHPKQPTTLPALTSGESCGLFIGPEGGFTPTECEQFADSGIIGAHLGQTVLRTETASIISIATALARMNRL